VDWHSGPTHAPPWQEYAHDTGLAHCPHASHVSTPARPEHRVAPGAQTGGDAHEQAPQAQPEQVCVPYVLHGCAEPSTQTPWPAQPPLVCQEPVGVQVCTSSPQLPHGTGFVWPGAQLPVHAPLTHAWFSHVGPLFCQVPLAPQVCGCWPLHCVWPGPQLPEHIPLTHVELVQVVELPQVPVAVHVWTPLPDVEHWVAPGVHEPWHAPATHAWLTQATVAPQLPVASQACTPLPAHLVAPGVHEPVQTPPLAQAWLVHGVAAPQLPVASQVCVAALPEHCVVPGAHEPWHAPPAHAWFVQAAATPQAPVASQACTPLPEHW
jgi:hypothetical protein